MKLRIGREALESAVRDQVISAEQADALWDRFTGTKTDSSRGLTVLAYLGAFVIVSAMTWFATEAFSETNPWLPLATGLAYFALFTALGAVFSRRMSSDIPAALLLTVAAFMVPLTVFAVQRLTGLTDWAALGSYHDFYVWIDRGWFWMEAATLVTAALYLVLFRFELLTLPLAFVLWFLSMDVTPLLFGKEFTWGQGRVVSMVFGLILLAVSYALDLLRRGRDYSFWLYLFGLLAFWCGVSFSSTDQLIFKCLYGLLNLALIAIAVLLRRPVFLVFGAVGVFLFLFDLSANVFRESLFFPIYLSIVGAGILAGAIALLRNQRALDSWLERVIPAGLKRLIPRGAASRNNAS